MADCVVTKSIDTVAAAYQDTPATTARLVSKLLSWLNTNTGCNANIQLYAIERKLFRPSIVSSCVHPIRPSVRPSIRAPIRPSVLPPFTPPSHLPFLPCSLHLSVIPSIHPCISLSLTLCQFVRFFLPPASLPFPSSFPSIHSSVQLIFYLVHKQVMKRFAVCLLTV